MSEAERLADALDAEFVTGRISNHTGRKAAAELRRLSAAEADFHMAHRMKFDEETKRLSAEIEALRKRSTGWVAPKDRYAVPVLFNPYTGEPRDVRDVQSDPQGILIVPPGRVNMLAARPGGGG